MKTKGSAVLAAFYGIVSLALSIIAMLGSLIVPVGVVLILFALLFG